MTQKYSEESIVELLHSIKTLKLSKCDMEVYFVDSEESFVYGEFIPDSFLRELLQLCEKHLRKK